MLSLIQLVSINSKITVEVIESIFLASHSYDASCCLNFTDCSTVGKKIRC